MVYPIHASCSICNENFTAIYGYEKIGGENVYQLFCRNCWKDKCDREFAVLKLTLSR